MIMLQPSVSFALKLQRMRIQQLGVHKILMTGRSNLTAVKKRNKLFYNHFYFERNLIFFETTKYSLYTVHENIETRKILEVPHRTIGLSLVVYALTAY